MTLQKKMFAHVYASDVRDLIYPPFSIFTFR